MNNIAINTGEKIICNFCNWRGTLESIMVSEHPFIKNEEFIACPECTTIDNFSRACSEKDCWQTVVAGFATKEGYKFFCHKHTPRT